MGMTYQAAEKYVYGLVDSSNWQRSAHRGVVGELLDRLGKPQQGLTVIHVVGTAGKGSTTTFLASILTCAGYRAGTYTSPHIKGLCERIKINGQSVSKTDFAQLVGQLKPVITAMDAEGHRPTYFATLLAMALLHFRAKQVKIAVIEAGVGGVSSATNVLDSVGVVLTTVGRDHYWQLGQTLAEITTNKAGTIKPGVKFAVSGVDQPMLQKIVAQRASEVGTDLYQLGNNFYVSSPGMNTEGSQFSFVYKAVAAGRFLAMTALDGKNSLVMGRGGLDSGCGDQSMLSTDMPITAQPKTCLKSPCGHRLTLTGERFINNHGIEDGEDTFWLEGLRTTLLGRFQVHNASLAVMAALCLQSEGYGQINELSIKEGLIKATIPARMEVLSHNPLTILDGAHSPMEVAALVQTLQEIFPVSKFAVVFASSRRDDVNQSLQQLAQVASGIWITEFAVPSNKGVQMAKSSSSYQDLSADIIDIKIHLVADALQAVQQAREHAMQNGMGVLMTGSLLLASQLRAWVIKSAGS